jgi:class 3 adenylate cyclase/tetratricopeptide (TPR) repeat protein
LNHLRAYLSPSLVEALRFDLTSPSPQLLEQCAAHLYDLAKITCTYLPSYLVEQIVRGPTPGKTGGQFTDGTLLFADISGFTAMSERLNRIGREGAEEITDIVNRYFVTMLAILKEHNGHLIKFGGDALLGLFPEPDSATNAAQAALRMQAAMAEFTETSTSQGMCSLRVKVAIHRGCFFAAQLGTAQGMEYALFGPDVNATAAAESTATAGQVLLDRVTCQAIGVPCKAVPLPVNKKYLVLEEIESSTTPAPAPFLSFPFAPEPTWGSVRQGVDLLDALTPYLPAGLLGRIATDLHSANLGGEHRLVAVLFANVHGLGEIVDRLGTGHEEQIAAALNYYFVSMNDAIHRFGGVVNKIDLYDHGDKLLAFFGAPLAHEDDAERAVRAALSMQESLEQVSCTLPEIAGLSDLCLSQQIGISYGYVFAGHVGTSWRHEYTVMGDEVNLAARLMSVAAADSITISSDIRRKAQALFDLDARGQVELRGKSDPVPIFAVSGLRAVPEPLRGLRGMRSPLVGREAEWNQLLAAVDQLLLKRGQIVSIIGEAGLGKSRLVAEMRASSPPVNWVEGRCLSYTESVSYWPFQESIRRLLGIQSGHARTEAWNKLREGVQKLLPHDETETILPYLANFVGVLDDDEQIRYLDAEALQRRTFVAIRTFIQAFVQAPSSPSLISPLVLTLEDIHWIDQASLDLLAYLMPLVDQVPLMLLLIYRPERTRRCWQIHERIEREFAHCTTQILLQPLTPGDSQQLLTNLVELDRWPAELYKLFLDRAEGNPLYLEEMLRALIDSGVLAQDSQGKWQLEGQKTEAVLSRVPDTLQGVMSARLDRLEEPCRQAAQIASVAGRVFPFDILAHIWSTDGRPESDHLNQAMTQLQQHEIVRETRRLPELVYTFKHALMQSVCYESLLARTRRRYHRQIAAYLESERSAGRSQAESNHTLIAHHAFEGHDWSRALGYQLLSGQRAKRLFANAEAIDHLDKALQSAEHLIPDQTVVQRLAAHVELGELLVITGRYDQAAEHLGQGLSLAKTIDDDDAQARVCRWLARMYELRGEHAASLDWVQKGLGALSGRETADASELLNTAGLVHSRLGDYDSALAQCRECLRIAEKLGEVTALARAHNLLGHITRLRGDSAGAIQHFGRAFALYERAGDINGQAIARNQIANACVGVGRWEEAEGHFRQARAIFDQLGNVYQRALADNNLGEVLLKRGDLDGALIFYRQGLRSIEQIGGSSYVLGAFHNNLGAALIRQGDVEAALEHLRASQAYFQEAQARDWLPELYRHFAEAALLSGDLREARTQGEKALALTRELAMRGEEGRALRALGQTATAAGQAKEAEQYLAESLAILQEVGDEYESAQSQLSLARLHVSQGAWDKGSSAVERCLPVFERLSAALDLEAARSLRHEIEAEYSPSNTS